MAEQTKSIQPNFKGTFTFPGPGDFWRVGSRVLEDVTGVRRKTSLAYEWGTGTAKGIKESMFGRLYFSSNGEQLTINQIVELNKTFSQQAESSETSMSKACLRTAAQGAATRLTKSPEYMLEIAAVMSRTKGIEYRPGNKAFDMRNGLETLHNTGLISHHLTVREAFAELQKINDDPARSGFAKRIDADFYRTSICDLDWDWSCDLGS